MSIIRLLRKKGTGAPVKTSFFNDWRIEPEGWGSCTYDEMSNRLIYLARSRECVLVDIQSVWNDIDARTDPSLNAVLSWKTPLVKPPFKNMWLEWCRSSGQRLALQIVRDDCFRGSDGEERLRAYCWMENQGLAYGPTCCLCVTINTSGDPHSVDTAVFDLGELDGFHKASGILWFTAANALSRMNCKNAELRTCLVPKVRRKHRTLVPMSVWQTIHIKDTPMIRKTGGRGAFDGEGDSNQRLFWIRGHYADYRNGPGLFGNPKLRGLFWVPEHQKGNPELGEVIHDFKIH